MLDAYVEALEGEFDDISSVDVSTNERIIHVEKEGDSGFGRHVTEAMLSHGYAVAMTGKHSATFRRVATSLEFE